MVQHPTTPEICLRSISEHLERAPSDALYGFCDRFRAAVHHFAEYGVCLSTRQLALITQGFGGAFGREVARFTRQADLGPAHADIILSLQRTIDPWMLVRVAEAEDSAPDVSIYFRRAMPLDAALEALSAQGMAPAAADAMADLGQLLDTHRAGIIAAHLRAHAPPQFKIYLHVYDRPEAPLGQTLGRAFERFTESGAAARRFMTHWEGLQSGGPSDAFVSLLFQPGSEPPMVKIDFFHLPLSTLRSTLLQAGLMTEGDVCPEAFGRLFGVDRAEHLGLSFHPDRPAVTTYFGPTARMAR